MIATSSSTATLPYHLRDWIDVEPGQYDKSCFEVSRRTIRLLRHDSNSDPWHRCFVQNSRLLRIGQFEHA